MHETSISKLKEAGELDWDLISENTATLPPCSAAACRCCRADAAALLFVRRWS